MQHVVAGCIFWPGRNGGVTVFGGCGEGGEGAEQGLRRVRGWAGGCSAS
eukprot:COSAG02_NODE_1600_length_11742_cov_33.722838_2_plen_49_part_00